MDRTIIDAYRAEEKELSETVHKKIETLMLIYNATGEFRKMFVEGVFLKPNQKVFFHVMHYLLTIFDVNEFRKRFYWPIVDKKSEGSFRTTVVEYLTYLNKKHNLQWKYQWNYLVQMPGGNKFLTFLIDFIDFVTNEIVKQKEKYLNEKHCKLNEPFSKSLLHKLKLRHKFFKVNALHYVESLEFGTKNYKENTEVIKYQLSEISQKSDIFLEKFLDENFLDAFHEFSTIILKEKFSSQIKNISESGENLKIILKTMENFEAEKRNFDYNTDELESTTKHYFPDLEIITQNKINVEALFNVFIKMSPVIDDLLLAQDEDSLKMLHAENEELIKLHAEVVKLDNEAKVFITTINKNIDELKETEEVSLFEEKEIQVESNLLQKLMSTPPIINYSANDSHFERRLPLMQSALATPSRNEFSFANNQTTVLFPPSVRKTKDLNKSQNPNNSKMLNASSFLLSLKKPKKSNIKTNCNKHHNQSLSELAKKWKEQELLMYEIENEININSKKGNTDDKENEIENDISELSIKFNKTVKLVETPCTVEKSEFSKRKLFLDIPQKLEKVVKGSPSFLKQESPLDFEKISTSPSGKLDPLVKFTKNDITKKLLSDSSFDCSFNNITEEIVNTSLVINLSDIKETIFNVSDSILKDIPM